MQIWPAIDLRGGKCVRLQQGDYGRETVFGEDPLVMAKRWIEQGAQHLHLVDLDGAKSGNVENRAAISAIVSEINIPCELGGGIRDESTISELLDIGLERLVIGTRALKNPDWFREMCRRFPNKLALGLDARDGKVATDGWLETSEMAATDLAATFSDEPLASIIYTDIAKDGMMSGPNLQAVTEMKDAIDLPLIASGGVTNIDDVEALARIGVAGCIIGRSLYEGQLTVADAIAAVKHTIQT
jgi:phosphoribosylformimino-5-aminoimidazole carboxamide ribotide isomerase